MSVLDRLLALEQFGVKLGLDNIRTLVNALGHPERAFASVLIAGTNGKGSVAAFVERALRATHRRTGRYTSPHLVHLAERFAIDGALVDETSLSDVASAVLDVEAACRANRRLLYHATFFEVTTAMAFEIFRRAAIDVAVLEVGLGGRFDATNVVAPVATAVVSIDRDHMRQLGDTLTAIAREKAGIARRDVPMIVGEMAAEPLAAIEQSCDAVGARVVHASEGVELFVEDGPQGRAVLRASTPTRNYGPVTLGLAGLHQVANATVAIRLLEELDALGVDVSTEAIETGLADARWPGRLEYVTLASGAELMLDAAHNPAGARVLADHVRAQWPDRPTLLFGASADKDVVGMLEALAPVVGEVIVTSVGGSRSASSKDLAAAALDAGVGTPIRAVEPPHVALSAALASGRRVVVAGSIFLLGALRPYVDALEHR